MAKFLSEATNWIKRSISDAEDVQEDNSNGSGIRKQTSVDVPGSKREVGGNRRSASTSSALRTRQSAPAPPLVRQADFEELEILGNSTVLDSEDCVFLAERLPSRVIGNPWQLVFTTERDGFSLNNIYRKVEGLERNSPTLIAIRDTEDCCFGALVSDNPSVSGKFYGTGESFLWRTKPDRQHWKWSTKNSYFMSCSHECLNIGAGDGHFGLSLDSDLNHGRTEACDTFDNDPLTASGDFVVKTVEIWSFQ